MTGSRTRPTPTLGAPFDAVIPGSTHLSHEIVVRDMASAGAWTGDQLPNTVWSARYAALFMFNRSPWVEYGYVGPISDVRQIGPNDSIPAAGVWVLELLDESDQPGALGYHEGQARISKAGPSGVHSERGIASHPETGNEIVVMKAFVKTSRADAVYVTEVLTHELFETAVDPYVNNESEVRVYKNPADGKEYIAEVGDPVQSRAWDVGAPEGRPCGVPEAMISDFAYPAWWGQGQVRPAVCFCDDASQWKTLPPLPRLVPFEIAPGGYMSVRSPGGEWASIYGSDRPKAEASARAFERPGESG